MKTKQLLLTVLTAILPLASLADVWQDPETMVNYEYIVGSGVASVKRGPNNNKSGSPYAKGHVTILSKITVDGKTYKVTHIGVNAFFECSGLTSVTIPSSITTIGASAFDYCTALTSVTIPESVTSIGNGAFFCSGITSITIPEGVTSIGDCAFSGCNDLNNIVIPSSVTSIGTNLLDCCSNISSIEVKEGNKKYDSRDNCNAIINKETNELIFGCKNTIIPADVTGIGSCAFFGCTELTSIIIPDFVEEIGAESFSGCNKLESVTFPQSLRFIGSSAFFGCRSLTDITIPSNIIDIYDNAFEHCSNLSSITSYVMGEVFSANDIFSDDTYASATLYVPSGTIDTYKAKSGWKNFDL